MDDTKIIILILFVIFTLIAILITVAAFVSRHVSSEWLMMGFVIFAMAAITCAGAAKMRTDADHKKAMGVIEAGDKP